MGPIALAHRVTGAWVLASVVGLAGVGLAGLLLGRAARREQGRVEEEIARIEEEAERQLPS